MFRKIKNKLQSKRKKEEGNAPYSQLSEPQPLDGVTSSTKISESVQHTPIVVPQEKRYTAPANFSIYSQPSFQSDRDDTDTTIKPTPQPAAQSKHASQSFVQTPASLRDRLQDQVPSPDITEKTIRPVRKPVPSAQSVPQASPIQATSSTPGQSKVTSPDDTETTIKPPPKPSSPLQSTPSNQFVLVSRPDTTSEAKTATSPGSTSDASSSRSRPYAGFSKAHARETFGETSESLNLRLPPTKRPYQNQPASKPTQAEFEKSKEVPVPTPSNVKAPAETSHAASPSKVEKEILFSGDDWGSWGTKSKKTPAATSPKPDNSNTWDDWGSAWDTNSKKAAPEKVENTDPWANWGSSWGTKSKETPATGSVPTAPTSTVEKDDPWANWASSWDKKAKETPATESATARVPATTTSNDDDLWGWGASTKKKKTKKAAVPSQTTQTGTNDASWDFWGSPAATQANLPAKQPSQTPIPSTAVANDDEWEDMTSWKSGTKKKNKTTTIPKANPSSSASGPSSQPVEPKVEPPSNLTQSVNSPPVFGPPRPPHMTSPAQSSPPKQTTSTTPQPPKTAPSNTTLPANPPKPAVTTEPPPPPPSSNAPDEEPFEGFRIQVDNTIWPEFAPDIGALERSGQIFIDFAGTLATRWSRGDPVGPNEFGPLPTTDKPALGGDLLPVRLYDLVDKKVVFSRDIPANIHYCAISHVWGDKLIELDGSKYGVDWKIPMRTAQKLDMMLEAARVIIGVEFVWIDVLCLDQRIKNENEISRMKMYYGNAVECLVWLDNTYDEPHWPDTLASIEEVNKLYKLDKHGTPTISAMDMFKGGFGANATPLFDLSMNEKECFQWVLKLTALEKAAWFRRVWTLQEAVIPDKIVFTTPERYIARGGNLFQIVGLCGTIAKIFMDTGAMTGVAISHKLQKSECWKILRLRQLYQKKQLSYWHVSRALRTRKTKLEQDRVFGACGMISGPIMIVNYDRSIEGLHQELWKNAVDGGDFAACCYLGGSTFHPHLTDSMGLITPESGRDAETHSLIANVNSIRMDGVGIDRVTRVHSVVTDGTLIPWGKKFPQFMDLTIQDHVDIANAFEVSPDLANGLCPGAFASIAFGKPLPDDILNAFGTEFKERYWIAYPQGLMMWIKTSMVAPKDAPRSYATVILWTESSPPQLAMVNEPVEGRVILVMPSTYVENPGNSCLVCRVNDDGTVRKIGVGVGSKVKAGSRGSVLLTA